MIAALIDLILSNGAVQAAILAVGGVLAFWVNGRARERKGRQRGAQEASERAAKDTIKRVEKGNEQVADRRGADPADRLRDNDAKW